MFGVFWLLQWWLGRHIQGLAFLVFGRTGTASGVYYWLLAPGVIIHEMSHWLMAKALFVPTGAVSLFRPAKNFNDTKKITLGYVEVGKTDPFRQSFIGVAPLVSGIGVLLLLAGLLHFHSDLADLDQIDQMLLYLPKDLIASFSEPINYFWLYLTFTVSAGMLPSSTDRKSWLVGFVAPGIILLGFGLAGFLPTLPDQMQVGLIYLAENLIRVFGFASIVNLVLAFAVLILEFLLSRLRRRKVQYYRR